VAKTLYINVGSIPNRNRMFLPLYRSFLGFLKKIFGSKKHKKIPNSDFFRYTLYIVSYLLSKFLGVYLDSMIFYELLNFTMFFVAHFYPKRGSFLGRNRIFATFRFNTQTFPESGKRFLLQKCQIRILHMFLSLEGSFPEKNFHFYDNL
jgi:hypothetical protein